MQNLEQASSAERIDPAAIALPPTQTVTIVFVNPEHSAVSE